MISEYHMERKINYFIFIFYFYNWLPTPPGGVSQFGRLERKPEALYTLWTSQFHSS
jgi:hypothetical protein